MSGHVVPPVIRRAGLRWYVEADEDDGTRYFGYRRTPWTARRLARTALGTLALEWLAEDFATNPLDKNEARP